MSYSIYNVTTDTAIAVDGTDYIYTKLPGNFREFDSREEATAHLVKISNHPDFRVTDFHVVISK